MLGLLAGIAGGFALAALSGARRSDTALQRLRTRTNASDAAVFATQAGNVNPDFAALARRPEVKALAVWDLMFAELDGVPGGVLFGAHDNVWGGVIDKPVVVAGRMFDPKADDEMVIDETLVRKGEGHLGQVFDMHLYRTDQVDSGGKPRGPDVKLRVVGVVRNVQQFLFVTDGQGLVSPGVVARYSKVPKVAIVPNAYVQLGRPGRDLPALQRDVNKIIGEGTPVLDFHEVARRVETTTGVESSALFFLFVAVAAAGTVLVGQALARSAAVIAEHVGVLRAIGMRRRELVVAAAIPHLVTGAVAAITTIVTALIASRWFPVGIAARLDPDRGIQPDWPVFLPGTLAITALIFGGVAFVAYRTATRTPSRPAKVRRGIARWMRRNAPVTVGVGTTMAFEPGAERTRVAVRPALVGAMVGVLGITTALTINHGLHDALAHPARAGVTWDATVAPHDGDFTVAGLKPAMLDRVRAAPNVEAAVLVDRELIPVNGVGVPTFMLRPDGNSRGAPVALTLTSGHGPRNAHEGAIGPATARDLHVGVGDTITVGAARYPVKVVGEALFPSDVHAGFDQGLWLDPKGFVASAPPVDLAKQQGPERFVAVRFSSKVSSAAATATLTRTLGNTVLGVSSADVPIELVNLRNVQTLPVVLAIFLALLAVAAMWHVLMTSARVRKRELAVLRAIGLTRRGTRAVLSAQATAIATAGLIVGVPVGIVVGRLAWTVVTGRVPLENVPPWPVIGIVLLVPAAIVIANVVAVLPSRRAVRLRPAQILRAE
ncbi:MAG: putative transport system permease protein [Actinomycetota bacterium]|nr:putative transport system permease protein [Actinomycetota bacterium]